MLVLHYDWLQLSFHGNPQQVPFGYRFEPLDGSNRIFSKLGRLCREDSGEPLAVIQYAPLSDVIRPDLLTIKFENHLLYCDEWRHLLRDLLEVFQWSFVCVTRLDICGDFQELKCKQSPEWLISGLFTHQLWRMNSRAEVFFGADKRMLTGMYNTKFGGIAAYLTNEIRFSQGYITGYRAGSRSSVVTAYLYNKTLELTTQTDKKYIRQVWAAAGFDSNRNTWRLEFSLKGKGFANLTPENIMVPGYIHELWSDLLARSFVIVSEEGKVDLFDCSHLPPIRLENKPKKSENTRGIRLLIGRLAKVAGENSHDDLCWEIVNTALLLAARYDCMKYAETKLAFFGVLPAK